MPIIIRDRVPKLIGGPGRYKRPDELPFDYDPNRVEVTDDQAVPENKRQVKHSICAFVKTSHLDFTASSAASGLRQAKLKPRGVASQLWQAGIIARDGANRAVAREKVFLKQELKKGALSASQVESEVDALHWPDFTGKLSNGQFEITMGMKCKMQTSASIATGFYIGNGMVVTAGHFLVDFTCPKDTTPPENELQDYKVIFGLADTASTAIYDVWDIKRIVHSSYLVAQTIGNATIDDYVRQAAAEADAKGTADDFGVLELVVPAGVTPPQPLFLLRFPAAASTDVFLVGHPKGVQLKYAAGGKIIREVNHSALQQIGQGTFTADLDTFSGNSGGPIMQVRDNRVAGMVALSAVAKFAASIDDPSDGKSRLHTEMEALFKKAFPPNGKPVAAALPDTFDSVRIWSKTAFFGGQPKSTSNIWTWPMLPPNHWAIEQYNRFSRSDTVAHLTSSFAEFITPSPGVAQGVRGHPGGSVQIQMAILLGGVSGSQGNLDSGLRLRIHTTDASVTIPLVEFTPTVGVFTMGDTIQYKYSSQVAALMAFYAGMAPATMDSVNLPAELETVSRGLHSWSAISLARTDNLGAQAGQISPLSGSILVRYKFNKANYTNPPHSQPEMVVSTTLTFRSVSTAESTPGWDDAWAQDHAAWVATIGLADVPKTSADIFKQSASVWKGPLFVDDRLSSISSSSSSSSSAAAASSASSSSSLHSADLEEKAKIEDLDEDP